MPPWHHLVAFGCATAAIPYYGASARSQNNSFRVKAADNSRGECVDAAKSKAPGFQRCGCCGQPGRKRNGCSCTGGQAHKCRLEEAGYPSLNFAQNYRPPRRKNDQPQAGLPECMIPRSASPEVSWLCRSEVIYMRWRRMLSKVLERLANDPPSESFEMLDDSPEKEMDLDIMQKAIDQYDLDYTKEIGDDVNFLSRNGRYDLLEVCTPPKSRLSQAVIDLGGAAFRAGVHNGFDMATKTGVRRLALWIRQHRPRRIVVSPPCTADCQLQNWNQKTPEDRERLRKKVQQARRIQAGCETIMSVGLQFRGAEIDLEQPQRSHSWGRSEALKRIREQTYETLVAGCAYGLRCPRSGLLLPKVWRICSTDPELQKAIGKRCSNRPGRHDNHEHGEIIGGEVVAATAFYPEALCKAWAKRTLRAGGGATAGTSALLATRQDTDDGIFEGIDEDGDQEMEDQQASDEELDEDDLRELSKDGGALSTKEAREIEHRLSRLHRNLGHPNVRTMFKILKNSGASILVLKMVKKFKCHACDSSVLPNAVRTAAGIDIPEAFEVMGSDGLEWTDPVDDATYLFTLNLDEGSGLTQRSSTMAHWLMGKVERRIQLFKRTLTKLRKQNHDCDIDEAISQVTHAINDLDKVGNHSPFVHAFGTGGHRGSGNPFAIVDDSNGESREPRRLLARQSFIEVEYSAERMIVELNNMEGRGATMSDLMEVARRGTFEDLTHESRLHIQNFEPQAIQPSESPEDNDEELFSRITFDGNRGGTDFELIDENMTVYFEMVKSELADSQGGHRLTSQMLDCSVANQKRKDKIEFHWGKLSPSEKAEFRNAMPKEVANWKQCKGLRRVPVSEVKDPADVIRCRWVLTRKSDGAAKARLVLLGYQTKDIGQEPAASPTASRRARNLLLTVAAANSWTIVKGDVTSAFLQANDLKKDLFVEADEALSAEFGVQPGQVLRVVKPGYGIGEAPRKWWQTVQQDFAKLGLQACDLEPCLWSLRCPGTKALLGLIMCHVDMDDGIDSIEQCGATIVKNEKGFFQHQQGYIDKLKEIFPKYPKAKSSDRLTEACDFTVLDWGSRKLKRVARSSLSAESQEASDAEGEQMMVRLVLYEVLVGSVDLRNRAAALHHIPGALVADCKAFYDGVVKSESAGLGLDERRTAIEALALRRALEEGEAIVRWVHCHAQLADGMTKASQQAFNVLHAFLKSQRWKIVHDERFLSARKRSALGKGIFDETTETDRSEARNILEGRRRVQPPSSDVATAGATRSELEQPGEAPEDEARRGRAARPEGEDDASLTEAEQEARQKYGLLGILKVIRMTDPDLNTLALGMDLTGMGLDLNSPMDLHARFGSPWTSAPARTEPEFHLPPSYYINPPALKTA
ncbi:unnamed protein product, partial [Prorocentrum cordatum]